MNVFSFCIYGDTDRARSVYYEGMLRNIELIEEHFPEWGIFIYIGKTHLPDYVEEFLKHPNVRLFYTEEDGAVNMIHRFCAIDEPDVLTMHVRDADSRIHVRDRWCIEQFMKSPNFAYTIRDNSGHQVPMMGGLWGCYKPAFSIRQLYEMMKVALFKMEFAVGYDQQFLTHYIYPKFIHSFMSFGYCSLHPQEHYLPIDSSLPTSPFCGQLE